MSDFQGFPQPTKNFFSLPNEIINIIADITNISELKIILYVIRHTWGYQEFGISKAITNDEFMHGRKHTDGTRMDKGTGLSEQAVRDGTGKAIKDGYLICDVDDNDKGRIKKSYRLRMLEVKTLDPQTLGPSQSRGLNSVPQAHEVLTSVPQTLDPRPRKRRPRTEKDTSERHSGNTPLKEREEESNVEETSALLGEFSSHTPSSDNSHSSQGGVTTQPASDEGVHAPTNVADSATEGTFSAQNDTLNLDNAHPHATVKQKVLHEPLDSDASCQSITAKQPSYSLAGLYDGKLTQDTPEDVCAVIDVGVRGNKIVAADGYRTPLKSINKEVVVSNGITHSNGVQECSEIAVETMMKWIDEVGIVHTASISKFVSQAKKLTPYVHSLDDLRKLLLFTEGKITGNDKTAYLGNVVGWVEKWAKTHQTEGGPSESQKKGTLEEMDYDGAVQFAQSLIGTYPIELLGTIKTVFGTWIASIRFGPGDYDIICFNGPEHYNDPNPFEHECCLMAIAYANLLASQQEEEEDPIEVLEAIAM